MNANGFDAPDQPAEAAVVAAPPASRFLYASGERPLDGYTIKRGVGQGGFGEIYYAVSDAGKEVAIKLIRRNLEVELRGIRQCLNLKHPNLLNLFDIRQDDKGDTWVVMEYVADDCLERVLDAQPRGLPPNEALAWFHGIAKGVAYLHDHGIVHRDLKPGNIFCDEGIVKVGDYGLSKFISCSRRSGHTESIGTVHYMAPEVANGRYGKELDIYALGVILYEMLTGRVPFEGESVGEVLMKHLTARPDVSMLPQPYRNVVARALEKDPAQRYASVEKMLVALPASAEVIMAETLPHKSVGRSRNAPKTPPGAAPPPSVKPAAPTPAAANAAAPPARHSRFIFPLRRKSEQPVAALVVKSTHQKFTELVGSMLGSAVVAVTVCLVLTLLYSYEYSLPHPERVVWLLLTSIAGAWAILIPTKLWEGAPGDAALRRFVLLVAGLAVGAAACGLADLLLVDLPPSSMLPNWTPRIRSSGFYSLEGRPTLMAYAACFGTLFLLLRWWRQTDPLRRTRFSLWALLVAVLAAAAVAAGWQFPQPWLPMAAGTISVSIQLASPWCGTPKKRPRKEYM